jgi:hypothetical protein
LNEGSWEMLASNNDFIDSMRNYEPIGCRDFGTRDFLRSIGVKAFFSGCLTMSLDRRTRQPENGKIFLIDEIENVDNYIPSELRENQIKLSQEIDFPSGKYPMTDEDVEIIDDIAKRRLEKLKSEAALVVTRRIHIAMPCSAMGIPVIFTFNQPDHPRVSVIKEILPIYDFHNFKNIDWDAQAPDMRRIKREMQLIFAYRLQTEEHKLSLQTERLSKDDCKEAESLLKKACESDRGKMAYSTRTFSKEDMLNSAFGNKKEDVLKAKYPIVLFGSGSAGSRLCSILEYYGVFPSCFCDNKVKNDNEYFCEGLPVITFETLKKKHKESLIFIATIKYFDSIKKQLMENGFADRLIIGKPDLVDKYSHFVPPGTI